MVLFTTQLLLVELVKRTKVEFLGIWQINVQLLLGLISLLLFQLIKLVLSLRIRLKKGFDFLQLVKNQRQTLTL